MEEVQVVERRQGVKKETLSAVPEGIWRQILWAMGSDEVRINFIKELLRDHKDLKQLAVAAGHFLFEGYPAIQKIFLLDEPKRDSLLRLMRKKLSHREKILGNEECLGEIQEVVNTLITDEEGIGRLEAQGNNLSLVLSRLDFILKKNSLPNATTHQMANSHIHCMLGYTTLIAISAGLLVGGLGLRFGTSDPYYSQNIGPGMLIAASILITLATVGIGSQVSCVRGNAAKLGESISKCFRSNNPEQRYLLADIAPRVQILPDDYVINNSNNDPDPLAENEAEMYAFSIQSNRPG